MRSSKAPYQKKIGGNFCPNPPEPTGAGIQTSPGAASNSAPHLRVLGWVMLSECVGDLGGDLKKN